jgi:hypothetical protein
MKSYKFSLPMFLTISMICSLVAAQKSASTQSSAPVPRLVNFTGKTTDAQGKPIVGIARVTFAIYKEQYEGAPLWLESRNVQADAKGNYTVQLGATKPDGLPLDLFSWDECPLDGRERERRTGAAPRPPAERPLCIEGRGCRDHWRSAAFGFRPGQQGSDRNRHKDRAYCSDRQERWSTGKSSRHRQGRG